ncbi:DUF262 domain-containing protein [Mycobacteroides abscessus]|uniref:DUF262 domain-containing protein n=1 Tax=Mycobacteroides abscessus TaxID=36809 RepID=UPI0005DD72A3|nr:DUF262 domain-containing protein [Mycobacteroides abscessus]CPS13992.1 Uncharacterized conserved protein [Mycobacteroides abscessus]CPS30164.1 Uncharacterized conserved protein [Mycobacteroides abscessus]CPS32115.1 Uncharacterized conserved protein [Mycobacteroides abscessus]CPT14709.1 Uncharacterized conserved protein [Mycobacteroides abscessus]CPT34280.1 Uncharacterized conserved protein [Mycobacteroides abscessus]
MAHEDGSSTYSDPLPLPNEVEQDNILDIDPDEEIVKTAYEITSYGADYPVDGLVKRLSAKDIVVPSFDPSFDDSDEVEGFQRKFVWSRPQMDRFVESLLLGLPVPGIFLVRDHSNKLLVLDGQQRLRTLLAFYRGIHNGREFKLKQVQEQFEGLGYADLDDEDRRRLDDSIIHATILRQEHPAGSQDAVYSIFERLNTGGNPLQPQEIRVALYNGPFLKELSKVNENTDWRTLYGAPSPRFKDHELILRVLALYETAGRYSRPLKTYLNNYLANNSNRSDYGALFQLFVDAAKVINGSIGPRAFRPVRPLNAAVLDAVMVGVMRRLNSGPITSSADIKDAYDELLSNPDFGAATSSSTAAETSVNNRLEYATSAFESVK